jgi:hypothetical protein
MPAAHAGGCPTIPINLAVAFQSHQVILIFCPGCHTGALRNSEENAFSMKTVAQIRARREWNLPSRKRLVSCFFG